MIKIIFIIFSLFIASPVLATTWYVDGVACTGDYSIANRNCTGSDGNSYLTGDAALQAQTCGANDVIEYRAGTYVEYLYVANDASPAWNDDSGTDAANVCTIRARSGEAVIIDHDGASTSTVRVTDSAVFVTFKDLKVTDAGSQGTFKIQNADDIFLDNVEITNPNNSGICLSLGETSVDKITIKNPYIHDCGGHGIGNTATNVLIYGDTINDCKIQDNGPSGYGITGGDQQTAGDYAEYSTCTISGNRQGIQHTNVQSVYVKDITCYDQSGTCIQVENHDAQWLIQNVTGYDNATLNDEGFIWIDDSDEIVVENSTGYGDSTFGIRVGGNGLWAEVIGTDALNYIAKIDHTSSASTRPITGGSWGTYWKKKGNLGVTWTTATFYDGYDGNRDQFIIRNNIIYLIDETTATSKAKSTGFNFNTDSAVPYYIKDVYVYHNTFWNNGYTAAACESGACGQITFNRDPIWIFENINFKNNIISESANEHELDFNGAEYANLVNEWDYNIYYGLAGSAAEFDLNNGDDYNFTQWKSNSGYDANSVEDNPDFVDTGSANFGLTVGSPAIDAGDWLTTINESSKTTDTITLTDSRYFHDGMELGDTWASLTDVPGDTIKLASGVTATITSINYSTHEIVVDAAIAIINGEGVSLDGWLDSAPDIGANEYESATSRRMINIIITD